ncbi:MAG: sigma-70 family RNA polymerase sigma factor [bacterium]
MVKARTNREEAAQWERLIEEYEPLLRTIVSDYYVPGVDFDDLLQEARLALVSAYQSYNREKGVPFASYCAVCVRRQMLDCLRDQKRKKHEVLNKADSIDDYDRFGVSDDSHPEEELLASETIAYLRNIFQHSLTSLEKKVLLAYLEGKSYADIAAKLGKSEKAIDNALHRARRKLAAELEGSQVSLQAVIQTRS